MLAQHFALLTEKVEIVGEAEILERLMAGRRHAAQKNGRHADRER
jgi:hypothetical protein